MKVLLLFGGMMLAVPVFAQLPDAQEDAQSEAAEYRRQVEVLNQRYEDFFSREEQEKRYREKLRRAVPELKIERTESARSMTQAAERFRAERKAAPDMTLLEKEDERERRATDAVHERRRRQYVEYRNQLKRISESARQIPPNRDAGLE